LLKKDVDFMWIQPHQEASELIRKILTSPLVVKPFNKKLKTELLTDALRLKGLGYDLIQRETDGRPSFIQPNSKSLTSAERGYAVIEIEGLAIQYAIEDCRFYLLGNNFTVLTNHRPLEGVFQKNLSEVMSPRLLSYRSELVQYTDMKVIWTEGKSHLIADALSRNPIFDSPEDSGDHMALRYGVQPKDPLLHYLYDAKVADPIYQSIVTAIKRGKLVSKLQKGHPGKRYKSVWDQISVLDDAILVIDATQIVLPTKLLPQLLKQLHKPHAGITRTRELARKHNFWTGLSTDIAAMISNCDKCQYLCPSQAAELLQCQPKPLGPMQSVSLDLYEVKGTHFVVMCNRFSYFCWADLYPL
jgi:hypothetical protein